MKERNIKERRKTKDNRVELKQNESKMKILFFKINNFMMGWSGFIYDLRK